MEGDTVCIEGDNGGSYCMFGSFMRNPDLKGFILTI